MGGHGLGTTMQHFGGHTVCLLRQAVVLGETACLPTFSPTMYLARLVARLIGVVEAGSRSDSNTYRVFRWCLECWLVHDRPRSRMVARQVA